MQPLKVEVIFPELLINEINQSGEVQPATPAPSVDVEEAAPAVEPEIVVDVEEAAIEIQPAEDASGPIHMQVDDEEIIVVPSREPAEEAVDTPEALCLRRIELLEQVTDVVESVVDLESARPAVQKLHEVAERLQPVRERLREMPGPSDEARVELAERSKRLIHRLNAKAATIRTYPDLQQAVEGTMRP